VHVSPGYNRLGIAHLGRLQRSAPSPGVHLAGREVHVCVGGAPRTARRYRGKDVVDWLLQMGYYNMSVNEHLLKERVRAKVNHYVTGRDGGRDIALEGMKLYRGLRDVIGSVLKFADNLKQKFCGVKQ
jgi:putative flavoprotein involved in K+ transport